MAIAFLGIILFPGSLTEPFGKGLRWPLRALFALWVVLAASFYVHLWGWVPGLAFAGLCLLSTRSQRWEGWKTYLKRPLNLTSTLLLIVLVTWFARETGAWVPIGCIAATFLSLEGYTA